MSVSPSAALAGTQGIQVLINDTTSMYVTDERPSSEPRYRARFYFDPNSLMMTDGDSHPVMTGYDALAVFHVDLRLSGGNYQLRLRQYNDADVLQSTNWATISDAPHVIEIEWWAANGIGANNGGVTLWIDGVQKSGVTGVDNDLRRIERVALGAVSSVDAGTLGSYFLDAFESRRFTYIGP